jgi:ATP-dependent DNA ligase
MTAAIVATGEASMVTICAERQIEERKAALARLLRGERECIAFNEHYSGDGAIIYKHACALGCEGIVSKRLGSPYRAGRADCWIKIKNPAAPAVTREAQEDWSK